MTSEKRGFWISIASIIGITIISCVGISDYYAFRQAELGMQEAAIKYIKETRRTKERHDTLHRIPFLKDK